MEENIWKKCDECSYRERCANRENFDNEELDEENIHPCNHPPVEEWYANVYQVARCYGGPEEGGWWYNAGTPVESRFVGSLAEARGEAERLRKSERYSNEDRRSIYSVLGSWEYQVFVEPHFAENFPVGRQCYE